MNKKPPYRQVKMPNRVAHYFTFAFCGRKSDLDHGLDDVCLVRNAAVHSILDIVQLKDIGDDALQVDLAGSHSINCHGVDVAVTEDGQMYVNYNDDAARYFSGCREVYDALNGFLPSGDEVSLEECIPDGDWSTALITFYAPDGSTYDDAYISDMGYAAGFVDRLQSYNAKFGGGTYIDFEGYYASVSLFDEADTMFRFTVFEDGNADFPMGDWTYGFYDAVDIYDMLWEELCVINGYY